MGPGEPTEGPQLYTLDAASGEVPPPSGREAELEARLLEVQGQLQRMAADFENFRRRSATEREELVRFAAQRVLENLLPVVDNFERALSHAQGADPSTLLQGVTMIHRLFMDTLRQQGVEAMNPVGGPFDPRLHEAVGNIETTEHPDGTVLTLLQQGYTLGGKVIRHAMVQVASRPADFAPAAPVSPAPAVEGREDITLEDLMAEASVTDSPKEDAHG
ncbi:MAG: nucleotide exchange factor GrpE [Candidatus Sericytochromatia bacterium]|nr:nucleotide exchange factor GrpE [Candidatus Tanganyikabacteria bacterium]